jgi:membrane-associated protease RseP (regulator of RpoE activity)
MRLVCAVLFVALTGSVGLADEAKPADSKPEVTKRKVPFRVVRMLPETRQVLLLDKNKGSHVLAEVGQNVDGFIVDAIDDDEVTLIAESGAEVILTAPDQSWRRRAAERRAAARKAKQEPAPVDPYATSADPVDPYEDKPREVSATTGVQPGEDGVRVASAAAVDEPADPYADPAIAAFVEAVGAKPAAPPAKPTVDTSGLASALTGVTADAPAVIARSEVNTALADFNKLASSFRAAFTAEGLRFDAINDGSLLARIGLRKGDVITSVDGKPFRSIDDAANLYARASTTRNSTIGVLRAGKPLTLRIAIQ